MLEQQELFLQGSLCCRRAGRGEVTVGGGSSGLLHLQVAWTAALVASSVC